MKLLVITLLIYCTHLSEGGNYRLPTTVKPLFYSLKIHPDLDEGTFSGEVSIEVQVKSLIESIILHSSNLTITELYLDQRIDNVSYELDPEFQLIDIAYSNRSWIAPGNHIIYIKYNGSLLDKHLGFFRAQFTNNESISYLAVTDFQPTYARRAFPCFDEPAFKARFQVTLVAPNSSYTALSNMRQIAKFETSYGIVYKFETSCVMSPYLLAFAISQYTYGEYVVNDGCRQIPIKIYSFNANDDDNSQPLRYVAESLTFYTTYLHFSYPLDKIDLIEYDRNQSGATENWGLITAKTGLLSPKLKKYHKSQIIDVLAHEVAHYWFGNLVTNNWWDDIWLQEGFAVFMALKVQDLLYSSNSSRIFSMQYLEDIYLMDQKQPSNAIVTFLETPEDIEEHFSDITYIKGAAVLRMIEMVLGKEKLRKALQIYVKRFAYKTATTNDFISIVENLEPGADMRGFIESYVYQNRYPLITIEEDLERKVYILRQSSCSYKNNDSTTPFGYKWTIPVTYITSSNAEHKMVWFHKDMDTLEIPKKDEKWIKFNHEQIGFYRVLYGENLWEKLANYSEEIDDYDRSHLLFETVQLYMSDIIPCQISLLFMEKFSNIEKGLPLAPAWIFTMYAKEEFEKYDKEALKILKGFMKKIIARSENGLIKIEVKRTTEDNSTAEALDDGKVPERVKLCAKWIRNNLSHYK